MAMTTVVGYASPETRSDLQVTVSDAGTASLDIVSSVNAMYGDSIRSQVQSIIDQLGGPTLSVVVRDFGALPYVITARVESALSQHLGIPLPNLAFHEAKPPVKSRLRRTRLYLPGNTPKFFPNADLYQPDCLILDLEDSVPQERKAEARALVRRTLHTFSGHCEQIARINSGDVGLEDIRALASVSPDVFLLPKVESATQIIEIEQLLGDLGSQALLFPLIETALGVENAFEIARSSPRIVAISMGIEDYLADISAERTYSQKESDWAQGRLINAARAAKVVPLASVFPGVDNELELARYVQTAKSIGYEGVGCIHPRQIPIVHDAFAPTEEQYAALLAIVEGYELALSQGKGAVSINGRMVDEPVYQRAKTNLSYRVGGNS